MAWNPEQTKRRLLDAAIEEFSQHGMAGARVDRIAARAGANKERIYSYFGDKEQLFAAVLREELSRAAAAVPMRPASVEDVALIAGRSFDYHEEHPHLSRLLHWEALAYGARPVPDEAGRGAVYRDKVGGFAAAQRDGLIADEPAADHLVFMIMALAAWWFAVPQVARMVTGPATDPHAERARRREDVIEAARRLVDLRPPSRPAHVAAAEATAPAEPPAADRPLRSG